MEKYFFVFVFFSLTLFLSISPNEGSMKTTTYKPHASSVQHRPVPHHLSLADVSSYEPFQLCLACRCCAENDANNCKSTSCCYTIDCNLPGKPFGTCAFTPKTCDCTSCQ
ncbi:hypothetical protein LUZ60_015472 [Juncus effusus]|nr:hypothetical protein LUZ60_015472 [Juncus effusus]